MESHVLHGYVARCPEIYWHEAEARHRCRLMEDPLRGEAARFALAQGEGCCWPDNPWRPPARPLALGIRKRV